MIKSVFIINSKNEILTMELTNPQESGFLVKNIDGLGPMKANLTFSDIATRDGGIFNMAKAESRNIVLDLLFVGSDVEALRHQSYRYFPIMGQITFGILTDYRYCIINGYVESNEPTIFSDNADDVEGCSISIMCGDPYWLEASGSTYVNFTTTDDAFEFPFSNESTTEKLLQFGIITMLTRKTIEYDGEGNPYAIIRLSFSGPITDDITIYNLTMNESMTLKYDTIKSLIGEGIGALDEIVIDGTNDVRTATFVNYTSNSGTESSKEVNIINAIDPLSDWLCLTPGDNEFVYSIKNNSDKVSMSIEFTTQYEGV